MKSAVSKQKKRVFSVLSAVILLTLLCPAHPAFSYPRDWVEGNMILINDNGGWCWYQDEKIAYDPVGGNLLTSTAACWYGFGGVGGTRHDDMDTTTFNIATGMRTRRIAKEPFGGDDHNMGAFWIRPDGRYLHVYCSHYNYQITYLRLANYPNDGSSWGNEYIYNWLTIPGSPGYDNQTSSYTNIVYLSGEGTPGVGRLYNIIRIFDRTPCISYSDDWGETWQYMGRLNEPAASGYSNFYHKFIGNGVDRIDFIGCEQHPRNYNNSIFHGYIQNGKSYNSYGVEMDTINDQTAPTITEFTPIFIADAHPGPDSYHTGWTNEIQLDKDGYPVCLYQTRYGIDSYGGEPGAADHRFFYARFDGSTWTSTELGKMGVGLHEPEEDYIGMGCIHPNDANIVYISTPFDPRDDTEYENHEIFKGVTPDRGLTWDWTQITFDSTEWNVRPAIPAWDANNTAVVWTRGSWYQYDYEQYDLVVVGLVEQEGVTLGPVTYIDANTSNTTESGGSTFTPTGPSGSAGGMDNEWHEYTGYGNGGSCYTAGDGGTENAPAIKTTISGLAYGTYDVFAYMWCDPDQDWGVRGGFEPSDMLCFSKQSSQHAEASQFSGSVDVENGDYILYRVYIGRKEISGGGSIDVYIDDYDGSYNSNPPDRTTYDGVGVAPVIFENVDIIYVDANAASGGDGHSWGTAYKYLQDALDAAGSGDTIRVAEGIYKPDEDEAGNVTPGDRYETFQLKNGVAIYGGFPAGGGAWQDRNPNIYETILSGDLNDDDGPDFANNGENSYNVVTSSGTSETAVLDGFTITAGNANGYGDDSMGGGMFNYNSNPTLTNCTFSGNWATESGGAMENINSSPILTNCTFSGNSAEWSGGGMNNSSNSSPTLTNCALSGNSAYSGGGMYNKYGSPTVTNCTFSGNRAEYSGGGMRNYNDSNPTVTNCTFSGNSADEDGGGMANDSDSSPTVENCTFTNNSAGYSGGAMFNDDDGSPTVINCAFSENSAEEGGAICVAYYSSPMLTNCIFSHNSAETNGGGMYNLENSDPTVTNCTFSGNSADESGGGVNNSNGSNPMITNCILWGNTAPSGPEIYNDGTSSATVNYSDVQGGWSGTGNIDEDPCFVAADSNDFHLKLESPCIDAGDSTAVPAGVTTDLDGNQRIRGPAVDMGVYESPTVLFVDVNAAGANNGSSWEDAYNYLQDALSVQWLVDEIRVAEGVYKPDEDAVHPNGNNDRTATFQLKNDVAIYGGFPSGGGQWHERDPNTYETILSGDLIGNDGPDFANNWENSYHVVTGSGTNATAVLDGFTITAGNANGPDQHAQNMGGGMFNLPGSPTLTNCAFIANSADYGGGMFSYSSSPQLTNCKFRSNFSTQGAGMFNYQSSPTLANCTFSGNSADLWAGGMENFYGSNPKLINCTFSNNSGSSYGGGMQNWENSQGTLINCTFIGNSAYSGGAMDNFGNCSPTLTNCIFTGNSAEEGGGMYNVYNSNPTVTNCTFSGNSSGLSGGGMYNLDNCNPTVTNCTFSGNSADNRGGGMVNWDKSNPTLTNCAFINNSSEWLSGGIDNVNYSNPTLINCIFSGNSAEWHGGGMCNWDYSEPTLTNCTFVGNSAEFGGGGMWNEPASPTMTNCTFSDNSAESEGGGIWNGGGSSPMLANCILWGNEAPDGSEIYNDGTSSATVNYSDVQGGWSGTGNIDEDPCFVQPGYWDSNGVWVEGDYHLLPGSACIDAGDNTSVPAWVTTDLDGNPRFIDDPCTPDTGNGTAPIVDMGAYEFFNTPPVACIVGGDRTVEAGSGCEARIILDGSCSSDEDSTPGTNDDIEYFDWYEQIDPCDSNSNVFIGTGEIIECNLPLGEHIIILKVVDKADAFDTNEVIITVEDATPPELTLSVSPDTLWPPNHKMVLVTPSWTVSDNCDESPEVALVSISSSEDDDSIGDGHITDDIQIDNDGSIYLRAERSGKEISRIYTLTYEAVDDSGNVTEQSVNVCVPHDQR